jgi:hypothetical protein
MSTTSDTAVFQQQLQAMEAQIAELTRGYPEMQPEEQRACMLRMETTMKQLSQIRHNLAEAEKRESGAFTAQILGLDSFIASGRILDLETSFQQYQDSQSNREFRRGPKPVLLPVGFSVATEHNHIVGITASGHLKPLTEYFMHFAKHEDVCLVLDLQPINMPFVYKHGSSAASIHFVKPIRDAATRALWRCIGELVVRVSAIDAEFVRMKVSHDNGSGCPGLPKDVINRTFFLDANKLPAWESTRAAGGVLDGRAHSFLRCYTPINADALQARITALYNEQCDALILLRKHQLDGVEFVFSL